MSTVHTTKYSISACCFFAEEPGQPRQLSMDLNFNPHHNHKLFFYSWLNNGYDCMNKV